MKIGDRVLILIGNYSGEKGTVKMLLGDSLSDPRCSIILDNFNKEIALDREDCEVIYKEGLY